MNKYLRLLIFEDEEIRAEPYSIIIAILFLILGVLITSFLTLKFRRYLHYLVDIKFAILPAYYTIWLLLIRYIISLIDFIIWYSDDGKSSLNGFYESIIWFAIVYQQYKIVADQDLIQISRSRIKKYNLILFMLKIFLVMGAIVILIVNFFIQNLFLETFSLSILFIISFLIYRIMKIEMENIQSIISKIRLKYLLDLWKYFFIYFLSIIIGYGLMGTFYPDGNINGLYFTVVAIFLNITPIMISLSIYWSVFIPQRTREKHNLSNPKTFH